MAKIQVKVTLFLVLMSIKMYHRLVNLNLQIGQLNYHH